MRKSLSKYRILNIIVMVYLIAAFSWWAILLFKKNEINHELRTELMKYDSTINAKEITDSYNGQKKMIYGEGLVFGLSILFGLISINRAFWSEINLNQRLNDFLLSVTHELKTPIATLKLANQTLSNENLSPQQRLKLLETSKEETSRLEAQVNNILAAAQIEKSYDYNFEKIDILNEINLIIKRYNKAYPQRKIQLENTEEGLEIHADKEAIHRVLDNLISNAIKYSDNESNVVIATEKKSKSISILVKDNGIGIKTTDEPEVWKKFSRLENEDTRETQGTGLGLWIVKEIISRHKGHISILPNSPKGSIFKVDLPL